MKKLVCSLLAVLLLAVSALGMSAAAEAGIDPGVVLSDLTPCKEMEKDLVMTGCEVSFDRDGVATFTLTAPTATVHIDFVDVANNIVYYGAPVMPAEGAYFVVDYGTLDGVSVMDTFWHYTRKDKEAVGTVADLYLKSMTDDPSYASYSSLCEKENGCASIWNWGEYVASSDAKLFTDKGHVFTSMELTMVGSVGAEITFYTVAVTSTDEIEGLGEIRPEPKEESSEDEPESSEDEPASSEEVTSSEEEESKDASEEESKATSEEESKAESKEESKETSAETSKAASEEESKSEDKGGDSNIGLIIGIIAAVVVIIVVVVIVIVKKKKK